jgi:hypothetical protein
MYTVLSWGLFRSWSSSDSHLKDLGVLSLNQPIRHEFLEKGPESLDVLLRVDEFDAKRHVLGGIDSSLLAMDAMMGSEACLRPQYGCAGDALFEEQRNNLTAQVIASGTCIFV